MSKTEEIDFNSPFLWLDDYIFDSEKEDLIKHGYLNNWIKIDLSKNKNQLKDIIDELKKVNRFRSSLQKVFYFYIQRRRDFA